MQFKVYMFILSIVALSHHGDGAATCNTNCDQTFHTLQMIEKLQTEMKEMKKLQTEMKIELNELKTGGQTGPKGEPGDKGEKGTDGLNGVDGNQGSQGIQGTPGTVGPTGPTGPTGPMGVEGQNGNNGTNGAQGSPGPNGDNGLNGNNGTDGPKGDKGDQGPPGAKGDNGLNGNNGTDGPKGDTGDQGPPGAKGDNGLHGYNGTDGVQGARGDQGGPGPKGEDGLNGTDGVQGPQGEDGPIGQAGDAGAVEPVAFTASHNHYTSTGVMIFNQIKQMEGNGTDMLTVDGKYKVPVSGLYVVAFSSQAEGEGSLASINIRLGIKEMASARVNLAGCGGSYCRQIMGRTLIIYAVKGQMLYLEVLTLSGTLKTTLLSAYLLYAVEYPPPINTGM